jgi:anti-sigma regulatory factor (Ser/Thr protein kinase)
MALSADHPLGCDEAAPGEARAWVRHALADAVGGYRIGEAVLDDALLIVSELVTNAVRSGCRKARLSCELDPPRLTVAVTDDGAGWPELKRPTPLETNGRGLWIVTHLAAQSGVDTADGGKRVWAQLMIE